MHSPEILPNEPQRLKNLAEYSILDSLPEEEYNEITRLASYICNTPISQLNITDEKRQFTKSNYGIEAGDIPREDAVCAHAINTPEEIFIVPDLRKDERFWDIPAVTGEAGLVFYAGVPLVSPQGFALGTLCVLDREPRELNQVQLDTLKSLANQVISLLELRRNKKLLEKAKAELEEKNQELEKFAYVVAHDIKSPLNSITGLAKYLNKKHAGALSPEVREILQTVGESSETLKKLVDGILEHSTSEKCITESNVELEIGAFINETVKFFSHQKECRFVLTPVYSTIVFNKTALSQILINLITNGIKYNDKKEVVIEISFSETDKDFAFSVSDNGPGIDKKNQEAIFSIFKVCADKDRFGNKGTGIGLATVKKLVTKLKGEIAIESDLGIGSIFTVTLPK